ncbi:hypothetical protein BN946_scf184936.g12 [Trametes cinnabarina]|uniref:Uncharacterized protein n=1 Tax=Pycnoporus cinnabarinus TaxID=5643 RepID=A0A060SSR7_PYCCI|nr:hypothetical protein BN946_scf184936.g12 [Trametes cinnabarina]
MMAESTNAANDAAPRTSADARTEFIEQIFQKVEEETERRAREQLQYELEEQARQSRVGSPALASPVLPLAPAAPVAVSIVGMGATTRERDRRRGSISVSRFGQIVAADGQDIANTSAVPSRTNSVIINAGNTGAFYQAQRYAGSADSFASSRSSSSARHPRPHPRHAHAHDEDLEQVTQMATIAGKVSIGKAVGGIIARRLSMSRSRTRSRDILTSPTGLVIGVSVEEATTEVEDEDADVHVHDDEGDEDGVHRPPMSPRATSFVYADVQVGAGTQQQQQQQHQSGTRSRRSTLKRPTSQTKAAAVAFDSTLRVPAETAPCSPHRARLPIPILLPTS